MPSFEELSADLDISGVNRYNPNNLATLEACVEAMVAEGSYDKDVVLTTLKLYQLNTSRFNESIVRAILLKTMTQLPSADFALAKFLIDTSRVNSEELRVVLDLGALLESCNFAVFWRLMRGDYTPAAGPDEPFRSPAEIPRLVKSIGGFEEAVRAFACRVISVTFQQVERSTLGRLLGGINDAAVADYAKRFGWTPADDKKDVYFVANHESTIKSRQIDEKLCFDQFADILKAVPRNATRP